jgi:hypothetical protein
MSNEWRMRKRGGRENKGREMKGVRETVIRRIGTNVASYIVTLATVVVLVVMLVRLVIEGVKEKH